MAEAMPAGTTLCAFCDRVHGAATACDRTCLMALAHLPPSPLPLSVCPTYACIHGCASSARAGNIEDYVHRIGRTGRAGRTGIATAFFVAEGGDPKFTDAKIAQPLLALLRENKQHVPPFLTALAAGGRNGGSGGSAPKKFGGEDVRVDQRPRPAPGSYDLAPPVAVTGGGDRSGSVGGSGVGQLRGGGNGGSRGLRRGAFKGGGGGGGGSVNDGRADGGSRGLRHGAFRGRGGGGGGSVNDGRADGGSDGGSRGSGHRGGIEGACGPQGSGSRGGDRGGSRGGSRGEGRGRGRRGGNRGEGRGRGRGGSSM